MPPGRCKAESDVQDAGIRNDPKSFSPPLITASLMLAECANENHLYGRNRSDTLKMATSGQKIMKAISMFVGFTFAVTAVWGQGTVNFSTFGGGVNAPVADSLGNRLGPEVLAQLYFAPGMGAPEDTLVSITNAPASLGSGTAAGYVLFSTGGGVRVLTDGSITVPGGGAATVQVRVWDRSFGSTFEEAGATLIQNRDLCGAFGGSNLVNLSSTGDPNANPPLDPVFLVGLQPFYAFPPGGSCIPEPRSLVFLFAAAFGYCCSRWWKKGFSP